eukprot:TRINITY_DN5344_c0_g1_i1.p1 TRINITY_DN5344_c0_g1~~TRINITY_DN5344_c0_g1_i1.p1  ORF type:complete len:277 (+),score=52.30 TRINITY_DN5344_c0_g1_i1:30-833(+)
MTTTSSKLVDRMRLVKHKILVLSGKGGVGKSMVSSQLALSLVAQGQRVGLLDIDLCGPSVPRIVGLEGHKVHQSSDGWIPVYADSSKQLAVMSIGFLLDDKDAPVIWRGPKKTAFIKQLLEDVCWGELDFLVIDTPPGTSDEHISVTEYLKECDPDGAVIVTTPQMVSLNDVRKEISFCQKINLKILGIVENMSGYKCPHCEECTNIFSTGGGEAMAKQLGIPFIGKIPIDPQLMLCGEQGKSFFKENQNSSSLKALTELASTLISQ